MSDAATAERTSRAGSTGSVAYSAAIADFASSFRLADAPAVVVRMAKRVLIDQLGCEIAGSTLPWSGKFRQSIAALGSRGDATVVYHGDSVSVDNAAFLNSAFGHANEIDDACVRTPTHAGSAVIPAALAAAEHTGASGTTLLEAIVIGYEVMMRVSYATSPHLRTRGHHAPPSLGPFAAAAATAHVLGLDPAAALNAIAIAGSHAAGLLEYTRAGGSVKRIHCAIGAAAGLRSAYMAKAGITGPHTVLEGEKGYCKVFADKSDLTQLTRGLGQDFVILQTGFKRYSCCFHFHTALEGISALMAENSLKPDDMRAIVIGMSDEGLRHTGTIRRPKDLLGAQFSLGFCMALRALRGGNGFWDYRQEDLDNPQLLAFADKVSGVTDAVANSERHDNFGSLVHIEMKDGRKFEKRVRYSRGLPENPMTEDEFRAKFNSLVTPLLGGDGAAAVLDRVDGLTEAGKASDLVRLLVPAKKEPAP
jgi:2-methylcitrate dehydratase PrpD